MVKKKKHTLQITYDHDYFLVGIKSVLEDYRLVFYLNKFFDINLHRENFTLKHLKKEGEFTLFGYENEDSGSYWSLIANKQVIEKEVSKDSFNLFNEISNTYILIPEEKTTDYFLKIEKQYKEAEKTSIIKKVNQIHRVITSFEIDPNKLTSKDLLIF